MGLSRQLWLLVWSWLIQRPALLGDALLVALRDRCPLHLHVANMVRACIAWLAAFRLQAFLVPVQLAVDI